MKYIDIRIYYENVKAEPENNIQGGPTLVEIEANGKVIKNIPETEAAINEELNQIINNYQI